MNQLHRGFSLLDLLLALSLLGVLTAATLPSLARLGRPNLLRTEATRLRLLVERLVAEASLGEAEISLLLETDSYTASQKSAESILLVETHRLPASVSIDPAQSSAAEVVIYAGQVSAPASIALTGGGATCFLRISLRGRVTQSC